MNRGGYRKGAGRKSSWNHTETQLIRVPKRFVTQLLQLARQLDQDECSEPVSDTIDFVTESYSSETLTAIAQEIMADRAIVPDLRQQAVVQQALNAFIERLME